MKLICPQCGARYEKGKFCLECGSSLQEIQVKKVLYCPTCQVEVPKGKFCPECGSKLVERELEISSTIEKSQPKLHSNDNQIEQILAKYRDEYGDMRNLNKEEYETAYKELKACVDKGNAEAMCFMALLYYDGTAVEENPSKAYEMLIKAEELGSEYAKAMLGIFYLLGIVVEQNTDEGLKRLVNGYKVLGHPSLAGGLAFCYYMLGDYKNALKYAQEAADKNDKDGLTTLGALYLNGDGIEKNDEKAFDCYMQAAAMGDATAFNQLGIMYQNGCGVKEDPQQAYFWWNEAAQKEDEVGMNNLAYCYKDGYGVEQNTEKSIEWFTKSAEAGYVNAMMELVTYYRNEPVDTQKEKYWLTKAAEQGDAEAMNQLGVLYDDVENKPKEAVKWYKKAIELGQSNAHRNLALCYRDGRGVKQDEKKAQELLAKAAELGIDDAQEISAEITANNEDQRIDEANENLYNGKAKEAVAVYKELAETGNLRAISNYANCLINGWGIKQDFKKGVEMMKKAADANSGWACCRMVEIFAGTDYDGKSMPKVDIQSAKKYLELAKKCNVAKKDLEDLQKLLTPSASISNVRVKKDVMQGNKLGVEVSLNLLITGLKGQKAIFAAYSVNEYEKEKEIIKMPAKGDFFAVLGLHYGMPLTPDHPKTEWEKFIFFISYETLLNIQAKFNEKLCLVVWNMSEKKPTILAKMDIPYTISCVTHVFRSNEWTFVLKK